MSVYVDEIKEYPTEHIHPMARRWGNSWCHMTADSLPELFDMARRLGLSPSHVQNSQNGVLHFDLIPQKRRLAVKMGAKEISTTEMIERYRSDDHT